MFKPNKTQSSKKINKNPIWELTFEMCNKMILILKHILTEF